MSTKPSREGRSVDRHWQRFVRRDSASPKVWMDAYLAAFARAEGLTLADAANEADAIDLTACG